MRFMPAHEEAGHEGIAGIVIDLERAPHLLQQAMIHHRNPVGHGHGFELIMGDNRPWSDRIRAAVLELGAHDRAERGIDIRERLVEQEDRGLTAADRPIASRCRMLTESLAAGRSR